MSSANVIELPVRQEESTQLEVVPDRSAQVTEQIEDGRPAVEGALKNYPVDWIGDTFTAEELAAEGYSASGVRIVREDGKKPNLELWDDVDELSKICNGFESITAD